MTSYHVTLGGQGLMVDLSTYKRSLATLLSGKLADGALSLDDLLFEGALVASDWSGGEGQLDSLMGTKYYSGAGVDPFTTAGALVVGPGLNSSFASALAALRPFGVYKGRLYAGAGDGKVYVQNPVDTWALSVDLAKAAGITAFAVGQSNSVKNILHVVNAQDNTVARYDGTTWTNTYVTAANYSRFTQVATAWWSTETRAMLLGPRATGGNSGLAFVAIGAAAVTDLVLPDEPDCGLFVGPLGSDTYYFVGFESTSFRATIYKWTTAASSTLLPIATIAGNYPTSAVVWNGAVYYGMATGGEVWKFDPSGASGQASLTLIGKDLTASGDAINGLAVWRGALWASTRNGTEIRFKRWDGSAWSEPAGGGSVTNGANAVRALAVFNGDLYVSSEKAGASSIYRLRQGVYPTSAKSLITSNYALEAAALSKTFRSVTITHGPLLASQSVQVEYQLDNSGSWVNLGTNSTVGSAGTTFAFSGTVTGKLIAFRISLLATASASPTLYELKLTYVPPVGSADSASKRQWDFEALFDGTAELPLITLDQTPSPQTGAQISTAVWALFTAAGRPPVAFVDLDGVSRTVYLVDLEETIGKLSQRLGYSTRGKLRLVEA